MSFRSFESLGNLIAATSAQLVEPENDTTQHDDYLKFLTEKAIFALQYESMQIEIKR